MLCSTFITFKRPALLMAAVLASFVLNAAPALAGSSGLESSSTTLPLTVQGTDVMVLKNGTAEVESDHSIDGNATVTGDTAVTGVLQSGGYVYQNGTTEVQAFPPVNAASCASGGFLSWNGNGVRCNSLATCSSGYVLTFDGTNYSCAEIQHLPILLSEAQIKAYLYQTYGLWADSITSDSASFYRICYEMVGYHVGTGGGRRFKSCKNNSLMMYSGGKWARIGACSYNSHLNGYVTCYY